MITDLIITSSKDLKGELEGFCAEKNIRLLTANGSPIDMAMMILTNNPLLVVCDERSSYREVYDSLIKAGRRTRFIVITERNYEKCGNDNIVYVKKGNERELKTYIREAKLESIADCAAYDEAFELYADNLIYEILAQLGFRFKSNGTKYIHDIISEMCRGEYNSASTVTKEIYPAIAKRYNTTPIAIERNIRTAIGNYWDSRRSMDCLGTIVLPLAENNVTPGNKEMIQYISNRVIYELNAKKVELKKKKLETI